MVKELYKKTGTVKVIGLTASKIDALKIRESVRKSVRIFDTSGGKIGISSSAGSVDFSLLEENAVKNLALGVESGYVPPSNINRDWKYGYPVYSDKELFDLARKVLVGLGKISKDFLFSGGVNFIESFIELENTSNTNISLASGCLDIEILFKSLQSANIIDGFFGNFYTQSIDLDDFFSVAENVLRGFQEKEIDLNEGPTDVIFANFESTAIKSFMAKNLNGETIRDGASYFSMQREPFNEKFDLIDVNDLHHITLPFDGDGFVRDSSELDVIKAGKLVNTFFDLKRAKKFSEKPTGTSYRAYNSSTFIYPNYLKTSSSGRGLKDFDNALLVLVSSGGSFQVDGSVSMPVQLGYVLENGKIVGRAPQLILHNTIENIFGLDYIGTLEDKMYGNSPDGYFAARMSLKKG